MYIRQKCLKLLKSKDGIIHIKQVEIKRKHFEEDSYFFKKDSDLMLKATIQI